MNKQRFERNQRARGNQPLIVDPHAEEDDFSNKADEFPEAVILFEAEFYRLPTRSIDYVEGAFDPVDFTRPSFRRNLGVAR